MKVLFFTLPILLISVLFPVSTIAQKKLDVRTESKAMEEIKNLPLIFRENNGQWDKQILYKGTSPKGEIFFLEDGLVFTHSRNKNTQVNDGMDLEHISWKMNFEGMSNATTVEAEGKTSSRSNYLLGGNPANYKFNISDYNQINYINIYPKTDLRYYGSGKNLKYDYILKPGGDINNIRMKCSGIKGLSVNKDGEMEIDHAWGTIKENKPYSYQLIDGIKKEVDVRFSVLNENTFGFKIYGDYNPAINLVIDPVTLIWGTYVGGSSPTNGGYLYDLTTDDVGNIYATGYYPNTFPTTPGAYDNSFNGGNGDIFVFKLDESGSFLHYATYIGGQDEDRGNSIAVNKSGEAFITGYTLSPRFSFPSKTIIGGSIAGRSVFVCKLSADGSTLQYSAYIGGANHDVGNGIIVNRNDEAIVVGETQSSNFPTTALAYDATYNGGSSDVFYFTLNEDGDELLYSTFLGGSGNDRGKAIAQGASGVYVTGQTNSANFPTTVTAFDTSINGDYDAFITKITGTSLGYSTFIGGIAGDEGNSIDVNSDGDAFITGYTFSPDYPKTIPGNIKGIKDVILTRLDKSGSFLNYSRFIGGALEDEGTSIIINSKDQAFIAGTTTSFDFPSVSNGINDADSLKDKEKQVFVMMINETGEVIKKSIKVGGSFDDYKIPSLAFTNKNLICNIVVGFTSHSPDLSTTEGSYQKTKLNGGKENDQPAIFKLYVGPDPIPEYLEPSVVVCPGDVLSYNATCSVDPDYVCSFLWQQGKFEGTVFVVYKELSKVSDVTVTIDNSFKSYPLIQLIRNNGCQEKIEYLEVILPEPFTKISDFNLCKGRSKEVSGGPITHTYEWSTGETTNSITINTIGAYWVKSTDRCGATATDHFLVSEIDVPIAVLGPDRTFCFPGIHVLNAFNPNDPTNPRAYLWSNGKTTSSINIDSGGIYSVSVINECGIDTDDIFVNALYKPIVNLGNDTSMCQNSTIVLDAGNPGLPKLWSTGATSQTISVNSIGVYWVDVTDVCGTTRDSIVIKNADAVPVINLGQDQTICNAFSMVLDATTNGSNYYWSTGDTSSTITITSGGVYHVLVTNGCGIDRDTVTITAPPSLNLNLGPDITACHTNMPIILTAANPGGLTNYVWSTGATTPSISVNSSNTYTVTVTNACGSATDAINVLVETAPPIVNLGTDKSICANADFTLDAGNVGASYIWSDASITQSITVNIAIKDTFYVDVTNSCGTTRDSIILDMLPSPTPSLGPDTALCELPGGGFPAITLDAGNEGATYLWSNGLTGKTFTPTGPGAYHVDITRCTTIRDEIIIYLNTAKPVISLGNDTTICVAFTKTLDAGNNPGTKFKWQPTGETTQSIVVSVGKLYIVEGINGCGTTEDSINIIGAPYLNLGPDVAACENMTLVLDAGNEHSNSKYKWSPTNEETRTIEVNSSGTYSVLIENTCGNITDEILVAIDIDPCIVELGADQRICSGDFTMLDAENDGAKYLWSTGATTRTITADRTGMYKVNVTNGCGVTPDSVYVLVDTPPSVNLGDDQNICSPVNLLLDAGNPLNFHRWSPSGQTTSSILVNAGGLYTVRDSNSCGEAIDEIMINEFFDPLINLADTLAKCIEPPLHPTTSPVILDAGNPGSKHFWTPGGETSQTLNIVKTGTYSVNAFNVCGVFQDKIYVLIDTLIPVIDLGPDDRICTPTGFVLDAGHHPLASIKWTPGGQTTRSITVRSGDNYEVSVTNQCGNNKDNINIADNPVRVRAIPDTSMCFSDTIQLSTINDPSYTYLWTPSSTLNNNSIYNPEATPIVSTDYVVLADNGDCSNADTASVIVFPIFNPKISASPLDGYIPLEVRFRNINSAPSHTWIFGDGETSTDANPTHVYNKVGLHEVVLITTSPHGCLEYDTLLINAFTLFIPNLITPNGDGKNDRFDLTNVNINIQVEIYNRWGTCVYKKEEGYIDHWDGEGESDGVYYFYIRDRKYKKLFKGWVHLIRNVE